MDTTMKTQQILTGSLLALGCALALPGLALADPSSDSDPALTQNVTANEASAENGDRVIIEQKLSINRAEIFYEQSAC